MKPQQAVIESCFYIGVIAVITTGQIAHAIVSRVYFDMNINNFNFIMKVIKAGLLIGIACKIIIGLNMRDFIFSLIFILPFYYGTAMFFRR